MRWAEMELACRIAEPLPPAAYQVARLAVFEAA